MDERCKIGNIGYEMRDAGYDLSSRIRHQYYIK